MTVPDDYIPSDRAVTALKLVTDVAAKFGQSDALTCLPPNHLRILVDAVASDLAADAEGHAVSTRPVRHFISEHDLARAFGFSEDISSAAREIVVNESGAKGLALAISLHVQQLQRLLNGVQKRGSG